MKPIKFLAMLFALGLIAASCGGSDSDAASSSDGPLRIAIVAPSASDDLAFTQSMVDSVDAIKEGREVTVEITDGTFIVEDAAAAIEGYAEDGVDIVIAHGTQYGGSLEVIAPNYPDTTFVWGTATDTKGLPNVFAYAPAADQGGYVNGVIAGALTETGIIGVVGPVEAGDAVAYIEGFKAGAEAGGARVDVVYTGSFGDVALAKTAAEAHLSNNADVLTGSAQMVVGAVGVASQNDILWFATQANQTELAPDLVVASQVYHWEGILEEIITLRDAGTLGGQVFIIDLANDGLVIELNDGYSLPDGLADTIDETIAGVADGSISTGYNN